MKMYERTKRNMERQRKERIREVYNAFDKGADVTFFYQDYAMLGPYENVELLLKQEFRGDYYFICNMSMSQRIYIMKLVYDRHVKLIKVSKRNFEKNEMVFKAWLDTAKFERKLKLRRTFDYHKSGHVVSYLWISKEQDALELVAKKDYNGKFYFICKKKLKNEICIMRLVYRKGAELMEVSDYEYKNNEKIFDLWLEEAV